MTKTPDTRRRWLGAIFLGTALAMLVAGQTVLRDRLEPMAFLFFWLACFGFTTLAMLMAFLDVSALKRRTREEQKILLESAFEEIERAKERKSKKPPPSNNHSH